MEVAVAMIWFAFCCVYMVLFSAVVASKENFTGYDVNLTAITNRNLSHDESLDNSAFALPQTTDVDSFTSNSSYKATEVPNRQLFNIEVLQPVSGHLLTPTIDVGNVCSCDELEDLCDINCCCDKECSQELALFTGCTMLTLSGNNQFCSHATASYALQYTVEGYSQLQSFVQQEMYHDSFCIQSHNRLAGFHFPAPTLPLARNFDSLFTQFNKFAFSSLENNDMSTNILAELQKFYQYGDAIMSAKENGKSGFLYLPSSSISVDCVDQSPVGAVFRLLRARDKAFRAGDEAGLRTNCKITADFKDSRDARSLWQGIQTITDYKPAPQCCAGEVRLLNDLNRFFARFDAQSSTCPLKATPPSHEQPLCLSADSVRKALAAINICKAAGPDHIPGRALKDCAGELTGVFTDIFNISLQQAIVPSCFKAAAIVPVPKEPAPSCFNDYRPVALKPIIMKCFERLVMEHIRSVLPPTIAVWGGSCTDYNMKALQSIVNTAGKIIGASLSSLKDIYSSHVTARRPRLWVM
ncbi:uncharacterized protein tctn1 isoform X19 [Syngnathus typhle]|uniref:uncharacterized protein tctn1 isoform X19 n=1 Tax=Syngnathus typhle TaxID=161592 RepID=UPI002A6AD37B|nr:uncharacterized protein tctn1 isoform X19 [Syngnathus typhle]